MRLNQLCTNSVSDEPDQNPYLHQVSMCKQEYFDISNQSLNSRNTHACRILSLKSKLIVMLRCVSKNSTIQI